MTGRWQLSGADRRVLPEGRLAGPMPWVIAIMMFLTVLAAAGGIALAHAGTRFTITLGDRISVQIVEADADARTRETAAAVMVLRASPSVARVRRLPDADVAALLSPWLGGDVGALDMPVPTLIDADLREGARQQLPAITAAVRRVAPDARIDDHAAWLAPTARLLRCLELLAFALAVLVAGATAAVVTLASRGALNTHRSTIDVLHLMGATDVQVARLFQRRIALDALFGGLLGWLLALIVLALVGHEIAAIGSDLVGSLTLPLAGWPALALLPLAGTGIAMLAARLTVVAALRRML